MVETCMYFCLKIVWLVGFEIGSNYITHICFELTLLLPQTPMFSNQNLSSSALLDLILPERTTQVLNDMSSVIPFVILTHLAKHRV